MKVSVVYEDNHVLVVNKPAGLATMGTSADQPSLARDVQAYLKEKYHKPGNVYLGIVSRLDAVTSGLMVFARTSKAAGRLTTQFQNRTVRKWYLAAVPGLASTHRSPGTSDAGSDDWQQCWHARWEDRLWKDDPSHRMRTGSGPDGQTAALEWRALAHGNGWDLLLVHLLTGRKHQIRAQFADRGYPLWGDRKYGSSQPFPVGIALHSWRLAFQHPVSRQPLNFFQPPPSAWRALGAVQPWVDLPWPVSRSGPVMTVDLVAGAPQSIGDPA